MTIYTYYVSHVCARCKHEDYFETSKREAAFMLVDPVIYDDTPCTKCGRRRFESYGHSLCEIDRNLLIEWANNDDLYFLDQDQELIIAEEKYIDHILYVLDNNIGLAHKRHILTHALCVLIYDYTVDDCRVYSEEEARRIISRVKEELLIREKLLKEAEEWVPEYIKAVVYPIITSNNG